jgi:hypothetical protein
MDLSDGSDVEGDVDLDLNEENALLGSDDEEVCTVLNCKLFTFQQEEWGDDDDMIRVEFQCKVSNSLLLSSSFICISGWEGYL